MEEITEKHIVSYIRIKKVRNTKNKCILLFRKLRRALLLQPLYLTEDDSPQELFWLLLRKGVFSPAYSIFDYINSLIKSGLQVQVKPLQQCTEFEFGFAYCWESQEKQVFRIELRLSIQENEAMMTFSLPDLQAFDYTCPISF